MRSKEATLLRPIETLAGGLGHPEGPDVLPDGRIVMVETYTSKLVAWSRARGIHDYALCGGGPNAGMLGSGGAVYITQNGGTVGAWRAQLMNVPSIQRAWPDGRVETVASEVAGPGRLPARRSQAGSGLRPQLGWHRRAVGGDPRGVPQRNCGRA